MSKEPDLLAVLDRGLAVLKRCHVLKGPVHSHTEQRCLVRQIPVHIVGGWFLRGEPVVVVMFRLTYSPLLELVIVPIKTTSSTVTLEGKDSVYVEKNDLLAPQGALGGYHSMSNQIHPHDLLSAMLLPFVMVFFYLSTLVLSNHSS